jgi:hypothetical protein
VVRFASELNIMYFVAIKNASRRQVAVIGHGDVSRLEKRILRIIYWKQLNCRKIYLDINNVNQLL